LILFFSLLILSLGAVSVEQAEEPTVGTLRVVNFQAPKVIAVNSTFPVSIDVEYATHGNSTIRTAIYEGVVNYSNPLWQGDPAIVDLGGDRIWNANLTSPTKEGYMNLTAFAYFLDQGIWRFYNNSLNGPGFSRVTIKVAKAVTLEVDLGSAGVTVAIDKLTMKTSPTGSVQVLLAVGITHNISVSPILEFENGTRLMFAGWKDDGNQTQRAILMAEDEKLVGSYGIQYLLRVNSPVSTYSKWYDAGSVARLEQPTSFPINGLLSLLGSRYDFVGWSGAVNSSSPQVDVIMNAPKDVNANFSIDLPSLAVPIILAFGLACAVVLSFIRRRNRTSQEPTSSELTVLCPKCGEANESGWTYCNHCGADLFESRSMPK
jgi:hypothetical protein